MKLLQQVKCEPKDEHSFILKYEDPITLYQVFVNLKSLILLPKDKYENANFNVNGTVGNLYGKTSDHPFLSYGVYNLISGYDNDNNSEYIFKKNDKHFKADQYPLQKIIYKIVPVNDSQFKEDLFQNSLINEIDLDNDDCISFFNNNPKYKNQYIRFLKNTDDLFLSFNYNNNGKTNFFINDERFRRACFLAIDRNQMSFDVSFLYLPKLSFVSSISLVFDNVPYIETPTHKKNLTDFLSIPQGVNNDSLVNTGGYNPSLTKELFNKVWEEYKSNNTNDEIKVKFLFAAAYNDLHHNIMMNIKTQLENCFGNDKIEIILSSDLNNNDDLNIVYFYISNEFIDNNVVDYITDLYCMSEENNFLREFVFQFDNQKLLDYLNTKYCDNNKWKEYFFQYLVSNNQWKIKINGLKMCLKNLLIEPHITDKERIFFLDLLFQVEKDNYEKMTIIPLLQKTKIKVYQDLKNDFKNMFLLEHFC